MNNKHQKGLTNELCVAQYFVKTGWEVYWPLLTQSRHDFIIKQYNEICAVQVKTAHWVRSGSWQYLQIRLRDFRPSSHTKLIVVYENQMWDIPVTYWKTNGTLYFNGSMGRSGYNSDDWKITREE